MSRCYCRKMTKATTCRKLVQREYYKDSIPEVKACNDSGLIPERLGVSSCD